MTFCGFFGSRFSSIFPVSETLTQREETKQGAQLKIPKAYIYFNIKL